ncbi:MAG: hypothetical protein WED05_09715 [Candidatus Atabeyarchaeum deiterrae]
MSLKSCPKCGGLMEKKGRGTDHNLRVEDRSVLRVTHERRLVVKAIRPLMYVCGKCGYLEFYVPTGSGNAAKKGKKGGLGKRLTHDDSQYFT